MEPKAANRSLSFFELPNDVLTKICENNKISDIISLLSSCLHFQQRDLESLWQRLLERDFKPLFFSTKFPSEAVSICWSKCYRATHLGNAQWIKKDSFSLGIPLSFDIVGLLLMDAHSRHGQLFCLSKSQTGVIWRDDTDSQLLWIENLSTKERRSIKLEQQICCISILFKSTIAIGLRDTVKIWDFDNGFSDPPLHTLNIPQSPYTPVTITPLFGKKILILKSDEAHIKDLDDPLFSLTVSFCRAVSINTAFPVTSDSVALMGSDRWELSRTWKWDLIENSLGSPTSPNFYTKIGQGIISFAELPDHRLAIGCRDGNLMIGHQDKLFSESLPFEHWPAHSAAITCILPISHVAVITGCQDGTVKSWNLKTKQSITLQEAGSPVEQIALTDQGIGIATADGTIRFVSLDLEPFTIKLPPRATAKPPEESKKPQPPLNLPPPIPGLPERKITSKREKSFSARQIGGACLKITSGAAVATIAVVVAIFANYCLQQHAN